MTISSLRKTLFDRIERTDAASASYGEDSFSFMNRVDSVFWGRIRDELEAWYAAYPDEKAADVRARFRSADPIQHIPAWWELYLHRFLSGMGMGRIVAEPEVASGKRPDFAALDDGGAARSFVEGVAPFTGITQEGRHGSREAFVLDTVNEVHHPDFFVRIEFRSVGPEQPRKRQITEPIDRWLSQLDADVVIAAHDRGEPFPMWRLPLRGWDIELTALPKRPDARGKPGRLIGMGPMSAGFSTAVTDVRGALGRKASHYGALDAPFVIAVMPTGPGFTDEEMAEVLFGSEAVVFDLADLEAARLVRKPDGFWRPETSHVAAVMVGNQIWPWTCATTWPHLWLNPFSEPSLPKRWLQLPRTWLNVEEGRLESSDPDERPAEFLGLDPKWPGPEPPFKRS